MKKTLLFVCTFISFATISQAQITKGSILLGGSIGLNKGKIQAENSESKSRYLNFNPTVGIAVKENWVMGITAGFSDTKVEPIENYQNERDVESYSGGVFVRRYAALGKKFYLYGNGSITYNQVNHAESNSSHYQFSYYSKGVTLSVAPGIAYAINKRFHLEMSLNDLLTVGYTKSFTKNVSQSGGFISSDIKEGKSFGFGTNFNTSSPFYIGFRFLLGK